MPKTASANCKSADQMACYVTFIAYGFPIVIDDLEAAGGPLFESSSSSLVPGWSHTGTTGVFFSSVFLRTVRFRSQNSIGNH